jgi:hypothetical protein
MKFSHKAVITCALLVLILTSVSCAPGNQKYDEKPAGFWAGLWHGFICVFTFIIGLFSDNVSLYETNNSGNWYDFGFLLGAAIFLGGGTGSSGKKYKARKCKEKEWEDIGVKVESKVRKGIRSWLDEEDKKDEDWEEIGKKVEEKIKRELRKWADK